MSLSSFEKLAITYNGIEIKIPCPYRGYDFRLAYREGFEACLQGAGCHLNPYSPDSEYIDQVEQWKYQAWDKGWDAGSSFLYEPKV